MRPFYARPAYAAAFGYGAEDVGPWETAVILRPVPGAGAMDAIGCYPLASLAAGADIAGGLEHLRQAGLVSVVLVADPLTAPGPDRLCSGFEVCRPFKAHYLVDPDHPAHVAATHRRWIRKAQQACRISQVALAEAMEDWLRLYAGLVRRHEVTGAPDFPTSYFDALAGLPDLRVLAASCGDRIVAMSLWALSDDVAYYHLGASDDAGYDARAMYGLIAAGIDAFGGGRVVHLGGSAGLADDAEDGLARFKRGFSNRAVTAYLCGARLDPDRYASLSAGRPATPFFPAYRQP